MLEFYIFALVDFRWVLMIQFYFCYPKQLSVFRVSAKEKKEIGGKKDFHLAFFYVSFLFYFSQHSLLCLHIIHQLNLGAWVNIEMWTMMDWNLSRSLVKTENFGDCSFRSRVHQKFEYLQCDVNGNFKWDHNLESLWEADVGYKEFQMWKVIISQQMAIKINTSSRFSCHANVRRLWECSHDVLIFMIIGEWENRNCFDTQKFKFSVTCERRVDRLFY